MGDGARRGRPLSVLMVAERRGLLINGGLGGVVLTAVLGGGLGGAFEGSYVLVKGALLKESLRRRPVPRSRWGSGSVAVLGSVKRLAI